MSKGLWGLGQCSVDETMRDPTAKAPHLSGHYVTFTTDATLGRRREPNDKNKVHRGLEAALKEISIKSHLVLTWAGGQAFTTVPPSDAKHWGGDSASLPVLSYVSRWSHIAGVIARELEYGLPQGSRSAISLCSLSITLALTIGLQSEQFTAVVSTLCRLSGTNWNNRWWDFRFRSGHCVHCHFSVCTIKDREHILTK